MRRKALKKKPGPVQKEQKVPAASHSAAPATSYDRMIFLQRTVGNRAARHLFRTAQADAGRILKKEANEEKQPCLVHAYDNSDPGDNSIIDAAVTNDRRCVGVSSVADMVAKVNAYVDDPQNGCGCVARLEINGHGSEGFQEVGGTRPEQVLDAYYSPDAHLEQLARIKFCPTALLLLLGCHVGNSTKGVHLLKKLGRILPGKLIGGAQHFAGAPGPGNKIVAGAGDRLGPDQKMDVKASDPFLKSKYVTWVIVFQGKEYVINGENAGSAESQTRIKAAESIKVITPEGVIRIK
ncbi:MAG: hypothetical protein EHM45_13665 [Desulfobacteraceae bacterium]|nr:MAG: hypothetical protein EHM45_13665 [Desulfobacteraceae bacterium]